MVRVVRFQDGNFAVQGDKRLNGRGCHICPKCIDTAVKKKALSRSFKAEVPDTVYKELTKHAGHDTMKQ